jgi:solute carrier family 27 fatty acid transporter 1/4
LYRLLLTKFYLARFRRANATVPKLFVETARKYKDRVALYYEDQQWTFAQLDEYSNRVANVFVEKGYKPGEEVALLMPSKPEYIGIWLGCAKAGLVTALINTNQRQATLAHSINLVQNKAIIFDQELEQQVIDAAPQFANRKLQYFHVGPLNSHQLASQDLNALMAHTSSQVPAVMYEGQFTDKLFYIYTSGTTGLPKAAIIKHCRYMYFGTGVRNLLAVYKPEIIYTCIPLYHLAGGAIGTSLCLIFGSSIVIKRKFSATSFWRDCARYQCVLF